MGVRSKPWASLTLTVLLLALVLVAVQKNDRASGTSGGDPYSAPSVTDTNGAANIVETTIVAEEAEVDIGNGITAHAKTFNGQIPGPEFRLQLGDTVIVHFENHLPEPTGIHWHGIELNNASDGTPLNQNMVPGTDTVPGGGKFLYRFKVIRPGVYWYHPHHHSSTNQVFQGMYGSLIVEDPNEDPLISLGTLPPDSQTRTLAVSDITVCKTPGSNDPVTFDPSLPHVEGALPGQPGPFPTTLCDTPIDDEGAALPGALPAGSVPNIQRALGPVPQRINEGQTILTNGKNVGARAGTPAFPGGMSSGASILDVAPGEGLRLRLLNTSAIRYLRLRLTTSSGDLVQLVRVGGEGGLLDDATVDGGTPGGFNTKYDLGEILLGPGERADVVAAIPASPTGVATLWTQDFKRLGPQASNAGTGTYANTPTVPVAHFNVTGTPGTYSIGQGTALRSATMDTVDVLPPTSETVLNPATFTPTKSGIGTPDIRLTNVPGGMPPTLGINGLQGSHDFVGDYSAFPHELSARYVELGDIIDLNVTNTTEAHHPFHPHGFSIQPISLTKSMAPTFTFPEPEFVDEVDVPAGYTLNYRVKFEDRSLMDGVTPGGGLGRWVFHCHIFFHAVFGMISEIVVTDADGNEKPFVNADEVLETVVAGQLAQMTGTFSDTDNVPDGTDPVTLSASFGTVTPTGPGTWSWSKPTEPTDTSQTVFITATDPQGLKSQAAFNLTLLAPPPPPPVPNASLVKACTPAQVGPGTVVTCTLTVNNPGPGTANNVTVKDDLAAGVTLVAAPTGGGFNCTTQATSPEISCTKASQPVGSAVITYKVQIPLSAQPGTTFKNTAVLTTSPADPVPGNNTSSNSVAVPACTKSGSGSFTGTSGADVLCGSAGNDNISALQGNDLVYGGGGNDVISGGDGKDNMMGGAGNDTITGAGGTDRADGGPGTDKCIAEVSISC